MPTAAVQRRRVVDIVLVDHGRHGGVHIKGGELVIGMFGKHRDEIVVGSEYPSDQLQRADMGQAVDLLVEARALGMKKRGPASSRSNIFDPSLRSRPAARVVAAVRARSAVVQRDGDCLALGCQALR